ncbi:MAG: HupE/UreJ family protein [Myxococcota bacterium]
MRPELTARRRRRYASALLASVLVASVAASARAHLGSVTDVTLEESGDRLIAHVSLEAVDAAAELGLATDASDEALELRAEAIRRWVDRSMGFYAGDERCEQSVGPMVIAHRSGLRRVEFRIVSECTGSSLAFEDTSVFTDDPQHESYVRYADGEVVAVLRRGRMRTLLAAQQSFLELGLLHFAGGLDHVLFVLGLVFAVLRTRSTAPIRALAAVVTAFTVGHSITLAVAALAFRPPAAPVEIAIAISVAVVALDNVLSKPAGLSRRAFAYAFVFGLIHGFGFSTLLLERGLSGGALVKALFLFNVGIELAQLAFVVVIGAVLLRVSKAAFGHANRAASAVMVVIALYWTVDRIGGALAG